MLHKRSFLNQFKTCVYTNDPFRTIASRALLPLLYRHSTGTVVSCSNGYFLFTTASAGLREREYNMLRHFKSNDANRMLQIAGRPCTYLFVRGYGTGTHPTIRYTQHKRQIPVIGIINIMVGETSLFLYQLFWYR